MLPLAESATYSIGQCVDCNKSVCGDTTCSRKLPPGRLCATHATVYEQATARKREANKRSARAAAIANREAIVQELLSVADPNERLVRALFQFTTINKHIEGDTVSIASPDHKEDLVRSLPDLWPNGEQHYSAYLEGHLSSGRPWDSAAVAEWFATTARRANLKPDSQAWKNYAEDDARRRRSWLTGKSKVEGEFVPAWKFEGCKQHNIYGGEDRVSQHVFQDGTIGTKQLQGVALLQMAEKLKYARIAAPD